MNINTKIDRQEINEMYDAWSGWYDRMRKRVLNKILAEPKEGKKTINLRVESDAIDLKIDQDKEGRLCREPKINWVEYSDNPSNNDDR